MQNADFENAGTLRASIHSRTRQKRSDDTDAVRTAVSSFGRLPLRAEPTWNDSGLSATDLPHGDIRPVSRRRRGTSRGGGADGDPLREARGRGDLERPNFNVSVPSNGYAWWYIDGISDGADQLSPSVDLDIIMRKLSAQMTTNSPLCEAIAGAVVTDRFAVPISLGSVGVPVACLA